MGRFQLARAGVLNVWQYDEQVFTFEGGRLLLRGANGAGKSKTLEMLLPFVLDGDKARMTASARHHTSLLWLMQEGSSGTGTRTGYLWVEFRRPEGASLTCAVGIRHSASAKTAATWFFTCPEAVPLVEDDGTPLSQPRCREVVAAAGGQVFESPRAYKEHVGRLLFGLDPQRYDDLLRLLYWLRQPQVGEDIEPAKLAQILEVSLPELDDDAVRAVGESLDELAAHGERVEHLERAAVAVTASAEVYTRYAATELSARAAALLEADRERATRSREADAAEKERVRLTAALSDAAAARDEAAQALEQATAQVAALEAGPLARSQAVLLEKQKRADDLRRAAASAGSRATEAASRSDTSAARLEQDTARLNRDRALALDQARAATGALAACELPAPPLPEQAAQAREAVSGAQAALTVVRAAARDAADAVRRRAAADERAGEAERREEHAQGRLAEVAREVAAQEQALAALLGQWWPGAGELAELDTLAARAREHAQPGLAAARAAEADAGARLQAANASLALLHRRREQVLAERDPSPPEPSLARERVEPGSPLWRLVDVQAGVDAAPIEAALEASGLLDAFVRTDGSVLGAGLDTVLPVGEDVSGSTLASVLRPDPDGAVPAQVVAQVLSRVALVDVVDGPDGPAAVGRDGSWRLGPLVGRANKPVAQYVGAAARAAERTRRIAEVDAQTAEQQAGCDAATSDRTAAEQARTELERWLAARPSDRAVRAGWTRRDERETTLTRAADEARSMAALAEAAATAAARAQADLARVASQSGLPKTLDGLDARAAELREADRALERLVQTAAEIARRAVRLEEDAESAADDLASATAARADADEAARAAAAAQAEHAALLDTLGADVRRMQAELDDARGRVRAAKADGARTSGEVERLTGESGGAQARSEAARLRLEEAQPRVERRQRALDGLGQVPGLLPAALGGPAPSEPAVRQWAALNPARPADANAVHAEVRTLAAGPAADTEPRVVGVQDALAVLARDETGAELPLGEVATRLSATVVRERELLTDRERTLFEEHLLGELGDRLRARRQEAFELVASMNALLDGVKTSQGIRVKLDWDLREDAGPDVRDAVALLGRAPGSLTADERSRLRAALSALIEVQRAAEPERGYAEHLARALDYRRWSAFRVRISRPETTGFTTLTRRTPLSQGEQKVVCCLPLFAAAAAHFTSVAGAAPYAPRLVLLDDAFPKIDVATHPLLFGLLVDLDLDFVITSERLWGDCATVPSLAIYEALRSPAERGIAQYRHVWDGTRLTAVGG